MNTQMNTRLILGSLLAFASLSGCKINVSGAGTLVDATTGETRPIQVTVDSKNTRRACSINIGITDAQNKAIYQLKVNNLFIAEDASNFIDSSSDECSKDSSVTVRARAVDRVIGHETMMKPVHCDYGRFAHDQNMNPSAQPIQHIKVEIDTVVTVVEGKIIEKATGKTLQTFTATSEPRYEATSSSRGECQ